LVATSLPVVVGLNEPQPALAQVTVQLTCGLAETSLVIVALIGTVALTCSDAGGVPPKVTVIGSGGMIVIFAEMDMLLSDAAVAVTVTVLPGGTAGGAVYVAGLLLRLVLGLTEPHAPVLPQVTDQLITEFDGLLSTAAKSVAEALIASELGGDTTNTMEIGGDGGVIGGRLRRPPHPANAPIKPMHMKRTIAGRTVITCLRSDRRWGPIEQRRSRVT
jgi:hypothetical protein